METLFAVGFILALVLPAAAAIVGACAVIGASFVQSWSDAADRGVAATTVLARHHPVGH